MSDYPFLPNTEKDRLEMLATIGVDSVDELLQKAVPKEIQFHEKLPIPNGISEVEVQKILEKLSSLNLASSMKNFIGGGAYDMFVPAAVDELSARAEFYTAYTPYQPEVSQGTLAAIFQFQSMITALTGMEVANASMYDGASAVAEAAILSIHNTNKSKVIYSEGLNPLYIDVVRTYLHGFDVELVSVPLVDGKTRIADVERLMDEKVACFILQNPNFFGIIEDGKGFGDIVHKAGGLFIVAVPDPMSLGILTPPGEYDADIVAGEGQQFGNYLSFGGPYLGFLASKKTFIRSMPGRIVGMTRDVDGKRGFVMIFQTREQHIRRAKATSNICTNQQLCALRATIYLALLGAKGFSAMANMLFQRSHYMQEQLCKISGVSLAFDAPFFREFAIKLPVKAASVVEKLAEKGTIPGLDLGKFFPHMDNILLLASSDKYGKSDMDELINNIGLTVEKCLAP